MREQHLRRAAGPKPGQFGQRLVGQQPPAQVRIATLRSGCDVGENVSRSPQRLQLVRQCVRPLRDMPAPRQTTKSPRPAMPLITPARSKILQWITSRWPCARKRGQNGRGRYLVSAPRRRIDFGDDNCVGVIEAGAEFLEQRLQPCEAMRLHHGDDLAVVDSRAASAPPRSPPD